MKINFFYVFLFLLVFLYSCGSQEQELFFTEGVDIKYEVESEFSEECKLVQNDCNIGYFKNQITCPKCEDLDPNVDFMYTYAVPACLGNQDGFTESDTGWIYLFNDNWENGAYGIECSDTIGVACYCNEERYYNSVGKCIKCQDSIPDQAMIGLESQEQFDPTSNPYVLKKINDALFSMHNYKLQRRQCMMFKIQNGYDSAYFTAAHCISYQKEDEGMYDGGARHLYHTPQHGAPFHVWHYDNPIIYDADGNWILNPECSSNYNSKMDLYKTIIGDTFWNSNSNEFECRMRNFGYLENSNYPLIRTGFEYDQPLAFNKEGNVNDVNYLYVSEIMDYFEWANGIEVRALDIASLKPFGETNNYLNQIEGLPVADFEITPDTLLYIPYTKVGIDDDISYPGFATKLIELDCNPDNANDQIVLNQLNEEEGIDFILYILNKPFDFTVNQINSFPDYTTVYSRAEHLKWCYTENEELKGGMSGSPIIAFKPNDPQPYVVGVFTMGLVEHFKRRLSIVTVENYQGMPDPSISQKFFQEKLKY